MAYYDAWMRNPQTYVTAEKTVKETEFNKLVAVVNAIQEKDMERDERNARITSFVGQLRDHVNYLDDNYMNIVDRLNNLEEQLQQCAPSTKRRLKVTVRAGNHEVKISR